MILVSSICVLFVIYGFLIFFADYIPAKQEKLICATTCLLLIILAGTREVGIDPDSLSYQTSFNHLQSDNLMDKVELSFIIITNALKPIYNDVHLLFFFYAILGVTLKFVAFSRYKGSMLLMVLMYISFYYELHETCQIRAGVLSGCLLLAIPYIADNKRWIAFFCILIGTFFHTSGIILLPLLFFGNKPLNRYWKIALAVSIPVAYIFAGTKLGLDFASGIPYIGNKIELYSKAAENGKVIVSSLELFSPFHLFMVAIFFYLLFWTDVLTEKSPYFPIMMKIFGVAIVSYAVFSFIPAIGERMGSMYRTIIIVLYPAIAYTLRPKWGGILLFLLIAFIYLNFSLRNMYGIGFILSSAR